MDKLEEFILRNREAFDDDSPGQHVWDAIAQNLPAPAEAKRVQLNWWKYVAVAAVGLVVLMSGFIGGIYLSPSGFEKSEVYTDYLKAEQYYSSQITNKLDQINKLSPGDNVKEDLDQIDAVFEELKAAMESDEVPNKQQVVDALIQTYQKKIEILERVLERIQSVDSNQINLKEDENDLEI